MQRRPCRDNRLAEWRCRVGAYPRKRGAVDRSEANSACGVCTYRSTTCPDYADLEAAGSCGISGYNREARGLRRYPACLKPCGGSVRQKGSVDGSVRKNLLDASGQQVLDGVGRCRSRTVQRNANFEYTVLGARILNEQFKKDGGFIRVDVLRDGQQVTHIHPC